MAGQGAVAIWHDNAPEGRAEAYACPRQEHLPERAGIPGFLRGDIAGCHLLYRLQNSRATLPWSAA